MPVEIELRELAANIQHFKDEQDYLVMRERLHRNSALPHPVRQLTIQPLRARTRASCGGRCSRSPSCLRAVRSRCSL